MANLNDMKKQFDEEVHRIKLKKGKNHQLFTKAEYLSFLDKVKASKNKVSRKTPQEYQRLSRYDVVEIDNVQRLVVPKLKENDKLILYTYLEEIFDIIHATHISIKHGGRNKMMKSLKKEYKNITVEIVIIYMNLCQICQNRNNAQKKPIKNSVLMSRCQIDIIDMQSQADGDFKFIMIYQNLTTKFVQLKALKSNSPEEVAHYLLDIFTIFGTPCILHSVNGREFVHNVIEKLSHMWNELQILNGKPQKGLAEAADSEIENIENMVSTWLETKKTTKWAAELKFIQLKKNKTYHPILKRSPYEAMFRRKATVGLEKFVPAETLSDIKTEEDLVILQDKLGKQPEFKVVSIKDECSSDEYTDTDRYFEIVEHPVKIEFESCNDQNHMNPIKDELIDNDSMDARMNTSSQETQAATDSLEKQEIKVLKRSHSVSKIEDELVPIKVERTD